MDTGAEVIVVPASEHEWQVTPLKKELVAANGSRIRCFGEKKLRLHVGTRTYEWKFLVADVRRPLIGADFLTHSSLLVDLRNKRLVHPEELNTMPLQRTRHKSQVTGHAFAASANPSPLAKLFAEFPMVTVPNFKIDRPKHHRNKRATVESEGTSTAAAKACCRKGKFHRDGRVRHHPEIEWAVVLAVARSYKEGRKFSDVRRLPPTQYHHDAQPVLCTADRRPNSTIAREEGLRQGGPRQRIPPDTGSRGRHCKNSYHDAFWKV